MRGRFVLLAILGPAWGIAAACSTFEEEAPGPDAGPETSTTEAGAEAAVDAGTDAADAADALPKDAAPPSIPNGNFENDGGPGCGPGWQPFKVSGTLDNGTPKTGLLACMICATAADDGGTVLFYVINDPPPGLYSLEAYHRNMPGRNAPPQINLQIAGFEGSLVKVVSTPVRSQPTGAYLAAQTSLVVDKTITKLHIDMGLFGPAANDCVLYDDLRLDYTP